MAVKVECHWDSAPRSERAAFWFSVWSGMYHIRLVHPASNFKFNSQFVDQLLGGHLLQMRTFSRP